MFKPQQPITTIAGHRYAQDGELVPHECDLRDNWYSSFAMGSDEDSRHSFLESWTTPAQADFNAVHRTCDRCKGRGATRKDAAVGCSVCGGTGSVDA